MNKINASKLFFCYALITINISIMLFSQRKITNSLTELTFIFLAIILAFQILKSSSKNSATIWPSIIIFLAMALANMIYIFIMTKNILLFTIIIILNLFGIVLSLVWFLEYEQFVIPQKSNNFETYRDNQLEIQNKYSAPKLTNKKNKITKLKRSTKKKQKV